MPPYAWTPRQLLYWQKTLAFHDLSPQALSAWRARLLVWQRFKCACCGSDLSGRKANLDHDHETGEVRGVVCWRCNKMLGTYKAIDLSLGANYLLHPPARLAGMPVGGP